MRLIAPSLLAADFLHLAEDVRFVNENADIFHLDVMDGTFVPNISFGFPVIQAVAKEALKPMDIHLMIVDPEKYLERFSKTGAEMISFHLEACQDAGTDPRKLLRTLRGYDVKPGLAIDPDVPVEELFPYLEDADFVLIMSVFAGFGGQKFIEDTYERVRKVKAEIDRQKTRCLIEVDGGVGPDNAGKLFDAGAEILVAGSAVFKAKDRVEAVAQMKKLNSLKA
ncbi:MAG: ribulose-phosphate 3-epimerase [Bacteroidales bacterium]|nr:ribulose-phosphate 3-epimerase [Bacteroidales bacterium]MDT3356861.1 ribulose-phosphate 3-epimerase [Bacteroidota bacterium]